MVVDMVQSVKGRRFEWTTHTFMGRDFLSHRQTSIAPPPLQVLGKSGHVNVCVQLDSLERLSIAAVSIPTLCIVLREGTNKTIQEATPTVPVL
jgi:hypothetical protein